MNALKLSSLQNQSLQVSKNSCCNFQHGCVISHQGHSVASGFNDIYGHAERNAISALYRVLQGSREGKDL